MNLPFQSTEGGQDAFPPFDLTGLKTYDLKSRPSKVFADDLGKPVEGDVTISEWINSLPHQLAGKSFRKVANHLCRVAEQDKTAMAALGGHVIKTGCGPYLIDWVRRGVLTGVAMNGAAAIHDIELALAGKTSEDVNRQLPEGKFGMARDTADVFAVAALSGAESGMGLGWALGKFLDENNCTHPEESLVLSAYRAGAPCTVHVAMGTDIVHMHPHVSGSALGEATMIDFRRLCTIISTMEAGVWMNLGSAVLMPEVFVKAVSVVRNFGYSLDGMVTVNLDKQAQYRSRVNVLERPSDEGLELIGHHELMLPLLHATVAAQIGQRAVTDTDEEQQAQAA